MGISTLEAIAYGGIALEGAVLCAVMDARCNQVYHGLFQVEGAALHRLSEDCALAISDLETQVRQYGERLVLLGDGAALCHRTFASWGARLAPEAIRFQRASSVALLGEAAAKAGCTMTAAALAPEMCIRDRLGGLERPPANADPRTGIHTAAAFYSLAEQGCVDH